MYAVCLDRRSASAELGIGVGDQVVISDDPDGDAPPTTPVSLSRR
jgi:hypothetical protein